MISEHLNQSRLNQLTDPSRVRVQHGENYAMSLSTRLEERKERGESRRLGRKATLLVRFQRLSI